MIRTLEQQQFLQIHREFEKIGKEEKKNVHASWHNRQWPKETWNKLVTIQDAYMLDSNDKNESIVKVFSALEGWSRGSGDTSFCTSLIVHYLLCKPIVKEYFSDYEMKATDVTSFSLTELGGGSSPFDMSVEINPETKTVSGTKWHVTNSPICDHFLVFGKDPISNQLAMAIVPNSQGDFIQVENLECEGMRNSPVGKITFENAKAAKVIVSSSDVKKAIKYAFETERLAIGFISTGAIEHHLEKLIGYVKERKVGGVRIIKHQYIQKRLTDIQIELDCLKALVNSSIKAFIRGDNISVHASKIKIVAIRQVIEFANQAMKCYGSNGVQKDTGLMQIMNDGMCASMAGGTEEIHRNVIFSSMIRSNFIRREKKRITEDLPTIGKTNCASSY